MDVALAPLDNVVNATNGSPVGAPRRSRARPSVSPRLRLSVARRHRQLTAHARARHDPRRPARPSLGLRASDLLVPLPRIEHLAAMKYGVLGGGLLLGFLWSGNARGQAPPAKTGSQIALRTGYSVPFGKVTKDF